MVQADNHIYHDPKSASEYLRAKGVRRAVQTLARLRCVGGGPVFEYFGRYPRYRQDWLDQHVLDLMSGPRRSTSGERAGRRIAQNVYVSFACARDDDGPDTA